MNLNLFHLVKFVCMVFSQKFENWIRIIYLHFSEFQLASTNCFSVLYLKNEFTLFFSFFSFLCLSFFLLFFFVVVVVIICSSSQQCHYYSRLRVYSDRCHQKFSTAFNEYAWRTISDRSEHSRYRIWATFKYNNNYRNRFIVMTGNS